MNIPKTEIETGLTTVAKLMHAYGEKYWPIFELLEMELEAQQSRHHRVLSRLPSSKTCNEHKDLSQIKAL